MTTETYVERRGRGLDTITHGNDSKKANVKSFPLHQTNGDAT